jgi:hypothetical protein
MTDFRALCKELVDNLHRCQCWYIEDNGYALPDLAALLRRARAALAEPGPPSLKEQALQALEDVNLDSAHYNIILCALEALPNE